MVLKIGALFSQRAIDCVDDGYDDGMAQSGHKPQVVWTVGSKETTLAERGREGGREGEMRQRMNVTQVGLGLLVGQSWPASPHR